MEISIHTTFDHTKSFYVLLKEHKDLVYTKEGLIWLNQHYPDLREIIRQELQVIRNWETSKVPDPEDPPEQMVFLPFWKYPSAYLFQQRLYIHLFFLHEREKIYENTRQFYAWLFQLLRTQDQLRQFMEEEFERLKIAINQMKVAVIDRKVPNIPFEFKEFPDIFSSLEDGKWFVPVFRNFRFLFPCEKISAAHVIGCGEKGHSGSSPERNRAAYGLFREIPANYHQSFGCYQQLPQG